MTVHLRTLDALRGIAIALVVLYHLWLFSWLDPTIGAGVLSYYPRPILETGFVGVELFFFISGFCLFLPHARTMVEGTPPPTLEHFIGRRIAKIVPSYYLALAVTVAFAFGELRTNGTLGSAILSHLVFTNQFHIEALRNWNGVFWSLSVEAQFYLIFPLLATLARRQALAVFGLMIGVALMYRSATADCCAADYILTQQLPTYLDLFAIGMASALATVWLACNAPRLCERHRDWTALSVAAFIGFFVTLNAISYAMHADPHGWVLWQKTNQVWLALLWGVLTVATVYAAPGWRRIVANPLLRFLSAISYNVYLWHCLIIMAMLNFKWPPYVGNDPHNDPHWKVVFVLLAAAGGIVIPTLVTYGFERPILEGRWRLPLSWARIGKSTEAASEAG